jgi:ligand-binding sensor domain-containing protein
MGRILILLCVILNPWNYSFGSSVLRLTNNSVKDGLSNLNVTGITQDQTGYIWVATMRGLNRYNGSEFTHYFYNPNDSTSINSNHVFDFYTLPDNTVNKAI